VMGNPMGSGALAAELVSAELACWFGLPIPDFSIIPLSGLDILMSSGPAVDGPAFASRKIVDTLTSVPSYVAKISNKEDIAKLVIFDTWVRNPDRYNGPENANTDNLLFAKVGRSTKMYAIDHSSAFVSDGDLPISLFLDSVIDDDQTYGLFPEFVPLIKRKDRVSAAEKLDSLDRRQVAEILNIIPAEWGVGAAAKARWEEVICTRARNVANKILRDDKPQQRLNLDMPRGGGYEPA
jgi:hypothetical protein